VLKPRIHAFAKDVQQKWCNHTIKGQLLWRKMPCLRKESVEDGLRCRLQAVAPEGVLNSAVSAKIDQLWGYLEHNAVETGRVISPGIGICKDEFTIGASRQCTDCQPSR